MPDYYLTWAFFTEIKSVVEKISVFLIRYLVIRV